MVHVVVLFLLCALATRGVYGQLYEDTNRLHEYLFNSSRYNRRVRPIHDQGMALKVNFSHTLTALEAFDIKTGTVIIYSYFFLRWRDELLVWDPGDYGGIEWLSLPRGLFWRPDLVLAYSGSPNEDTNLMDSDYSMAFIDHKGNVNMIPAGKFQTRCNVNTVAYPLDRHKCLFSLILANYQTPEVELNQEASSPRVYEFFQENEEWQVVNFTGVHSNADKYEGLASGFIVNEFYLVRRPTYELMKTCVPLVLLTVTNLATFFVPVDCGERLSLTVANFLALVFTNFMVMDGLPSNSLQLTVPSVSVLMINILGTFVVFWSIFVVRLYRIQTHQLKLPLFLQKAIARKLIQNDINFTQSPASSPKLSQDPNGAPLPFVAPNRDIRHRKLVSTIAGSLDKDGVKPIEITAVDVAIYLDQWGCVVTIVILLVTMVAYMIYFYNSPDPYVFSPIKTTG